MLRRLAPWLIRSTAISFAGFTAGLIGLGGVGGNRIYSTALLPASVMLSMAWLLMLIVAMVVHHWRGLWLLFGAPLALFWPTMTVLFANAIADCSANHPVDAAMACFP
jgi:hypothetical protein